MTADALGNYKMVLLPTVDGSGLGTGTQAEFEHFLQNQVSTTSLKEETEEPAVTETEIPESEESEPEVVIPFTTNE